MVIEERGVLDRVLVANEVVEEMRCQRRKSIVVEVNFEKTITTQMEFSQLHARETRIL